MRVLQILSSTDYAGAEAMAAELGRQLSLLGVELDLAVLDNAGKGNDEIFRVVGDRAAAAYRIPCARQFDPATLGALRHKLAERRIDVVHSHCYKTTFYAGLLRPFGSFRLVSTYHNWLTHTRALRVYAAIDKNLARLNDYSVGVASPVVQELHRYVKPQRLAQIDNGIDVERFLPTADAQAAKAALGVDPARFTLGFVGRLSPEKGLHFLLPALADASLAHVDLLIAGDGPERTAVEARIAELGLQPRVRMLGYRRDTAAIYAALDGFALPSTVEAFPMVLLEAMSCALPVLCTSVGEVPRMVEHHRTGWRVAPGQPGELRAALVEMSAQPEAARAIGRAARDKVVAEFSSRAMAGRYLDLYRKALDRR